MIRIYIGKSAAGKDYFYRKDIEEKNFKPIVSYTTRPIRDKEINGKDYNFISKKKFAYLEKSGLIIESRSYNTKVNGKDDIWYYGTPKIQNPDEDYVVVVDIDGAKALVTAFPDKCEILYIEADSKIRTERAKHRGSFDETEWNRRLKDDEIKFSDKRLKELETLYGKPIKHIINNK